jgi:3-methyl-2-oxobutanoate hydroxymethyltransferase
MPKIPKVIGIGPKNCSQHCKWGIKEMHITIDNIKEMKLNKEKIVMLTAYDYPTAKLVDETNVPLILVGDSLGMVVLGYDSTIPVTMEDMIHHTKAVSRGTKHALVIADMPFMTYHTSSTDAMRNAARFLQEAGAHAVKLEGGQVVTETIKRMVDCGIPVMGHIGLTPQSIHQLGGYKLQGKTPEAAKYLLDDACALEQAGVFAIVLELIPSELSKLITKNVNIPTIGIGAGADCDGQVQVIHDILGLFNDFVPKHAKRYAVLADIVKAAISNYMVEVQSGTFPTSAHSSSINETKLKNAGHCCTPHK